MPEKHRADFRAAERQPQVSGGARVHRIHCKSARLGGRLREKFFVQAHSWKPQAKMGGIEVKVGSLARKKRIPEFYPRINTDYRGFYLLITSPFHRLPEMIAIANGVSFTHLVCPS